jgi:hypothetical protein
MFEVPSGEPSKSIEMLGRLWDWMLASNADRRGVVIAIGGGVVGDLAGFAAASFARGVRLVQVPTTLLSMVDSSVGGKTGINLEGGKNMVGAFWQPSLVLIDTATLGTLGQRDYRGGLAEVIKYGVIEDAAFFEWLERHVERLDAREHEVVAEAIRHCCRIKAAVVADDERETSGRRAILNYGHARGGGRDRHVDGGAAGEVVGAGRRCLCRAAGRVDHRLRLADPLGGSGSVGDDPGDAERQEGRPCGLASDPSDPVGSRRTGPVRGYRSDHAGDRGLSVICPVGGSGLLVARACWSQGPVGHNRLHSCLAVGGIS